MKYSDFYAMVCDKAEEIPQLPAFRMEKNGRVEEVSYSAFKDAVDGRALELEKYREEGYLCAAVVCTGTYLSVLDIFSAARAGFQLVLMDQSLSDEELEELEKATDVSILLEDGEIEIREKTEVPENSEKDVLFFTSGTTSHSKAVVLTQESLCASAWNGSALLPLKEKDTLMCMLPLNHVFGFVCAMMWALTNGASVALGRGMRHYADDCALFHPTVVSVVPMLLNFLLKNNCLNSELKLVLIGAGDCPKKLINEAKERGLRVSFGYGLTETSSGVALSLGEDPYLLSVCPDFEVRAGADGEILVSNNSCMMKGYYRAPEDTNEVLRDGVLYTGDLGIVNGNKIRILGRKKEIVVLLDGTKIYIPEYEKALAARLPGRDFAVVGIEGRPVLFVYNPRKELDNGLDAVCIGRAIEGFMMKLPRGQQISRIQVVNERLPRTATGKIKRWELERENGKNVQK